MSNLTSNPNGLIVSRYHKYGYTVAVFLDRDNGMPDFTENFGNSPFESTAVITSSGKLSLSTLRRYAKSTSVELAKEHGINAKSIFVERDRDFDGEMERTLQMKH